MSTVASSHRKKSTSGQTRRIVPPSVLPQTARKGLKAAMRSASSSEPMSPACQISSTSVKAAQRVVEGAVRVRDESDAFHVREVWNARRPPARQSAPIAPATTAAARSADRKSQARLMAANPARPAGRTRRRSRRRRGAAAAAGGSRRRPKGRKDRIRSVRRRRRGVIR